MRTRAGFGLAIPAAVSTACFASAAFASGHRCVEVSNIVGSERCTRYGDTWSTEKHPPLVFSIGVMEDHFGIGGMGFTHASKGSASYAFEGDALGPSPHATTIGSEIGLTGYFAGPFYTGMDIGFGFGSARSDAPGAQTIGATTIRMGPVLGARLPLGHFSLRGELVGSMQFTLLSQTPSSVRGDIAIEGQSSGAAALSWPLQARAIVDAWTCPWVTVSAFGGWDIVGDSSRTIGVMLGWHVRAFDGAFAL